MCFWNIWVNLKNCCTESRQTFPSIKFTNACSFDSQNWIVRSIEFFSLCPPQCKTYLTNNYRIYHYHTFYNFFKKNKVLTIVLLSSTRLISLFFISLPVVRDVMNTKSPEDLITPKRSIINK